MAMNIIPEDEVIKSNDNITVLNMATDQYIFWNRSEAVSLDILKELSKE